jgi:hypothetical protein
MTTLYQIYNEATKTPVISCASLETLAARQSTPTDFGTPRTCNWNVRYQAMTNTPSAAGYTIDVYAAWSSGVLAGIWPGNLGVTDSAYLGYTPSPVLNAIAQLDYVGSLILSNNATPSGQIQDVGIVCPKQQYGIFVVYNASLVNLSSNTYNNNSIVCTPIVDAGI